MAEFYEVADVLAAIVTGAFGAVRARRAGDADCGILRDCLAGQPDNRFPAGGTYLTARRASDVSTRTSLMAQVQDAHGPSPMSDQAQRQVGADLHDGPAQLLGFVALRLDQLRDEVKGDAGQQDLDQIDRAVKDAMREIRPSRAGFRCRKSKAAALLKRCATW